MEDNKEKVTIGLVETQKSGKPTKDKREPKERFSHKIV